MRLRRPRFMTLPRLLLVAWFLSDVAQAVNMSCLVMRPGYGLVTEECPSHAVGCRIRAKKDHIEWYELSRLYDRNQLVCVYPEEYKSMTGCMRKPSGSIRCWCGGRENCNDPETSRDLYEAFTEGDNEAVEKISEWLKSEKDESSWKKFTTTEEPPPTTTTRRSTTPRRTTIRKKITTTTTTTTTTTEKPSTTTTPITTAPPPTPKKSTKRIGSATTSGPPMFPKGASKAQVINIVDIREKAVPLPNDDISLDDTFEETRKKLEKEMKEEDERLREMLADEEEEENSNDISDIDDDDITAEDQREEERERYRMERRRAEERRLQEDTILRKMEEEEIREAGKDRPNRRETDEYGNDFENSATGVFGSVLSIIITVLFI